MLVMALAATLIGFGLLVVALVTGTLWLAVACIAVCILGGLFLLGDLLGLGDALTLRRSRRTDSVRTSDVDHSRAPDDAGDSAVVNSAGDADLADTEVTTEFPRIDESEPIVSLDGPDSHWPTDIGDSVAAGLSETEPDEADAARTGHDEQADLTPHRRSTHSRGDDDAGTVPPPRHGRHGSTEPDLAPRRAPRHGSPD